uniref:helix-turn-helix domain-containing protein n=1 Tax=Actinomadura sp. CA-154981 TaxID=3240037 RepID=UPI003F49AA51
MTGSPNFGEKLRALLTERKISQRQLAKLVPCDDGYLSRVANGHRRPPPELAERLDELLDAGGTLVACLPQSMPRRVPPLTREQSMRRMTPARIDAVLTHLTDMWHALVKTDNLLGPRHALDGVTLQLDILGSFLRTARPPQRERALRLAAQYAESAAWLHEDAGNIDRSRFWTGQAMEWAVAAGDHRMVAWVLFRRSQQAQTGPEMLGLAEAARREQRDEPSPMLAAILQQTAHGHARDRAETECLRTLDQALEFAVSDEAADAGVGHGSFCSPAYLEMQRGCCWSRLGHPDRAVAALTTALEQLPAAYQRDRGLAHAALAEACLAAGQPERAALAAVDALTVAQESGSARIGGTVVKVAAGLHSHRELGEVAAFLSQMTGDA